MRVKVNGDNVVLNINGEELIVSMDGYDIINSAGALKTIRKTNSTWYIKGKNGAKMSLQRFILTKGGIMDLEKGIKVIGLNGIVNDKTTKNLKAVDSKEFARIKLLPARKNNKNK